jgi:hypothetical protein
VWSPFGGGYSIGVCGLAGGLLVVVSRTSPRWAFVPTVWYVLALTGWSVAGVAGAAVGVTVAVLLLDFRPTAAKPTAVAGMLILLLFLDLHGAALAAGALTTWLLIDPGRRPAP